MYAQPCEPPLLIWTQIPTRRFPRGSRLQCTSPSTRPHTFLFPSFFFLLSAPMMRRVQCLQGRRGSNMSNLPRSPRVIYSNDMERELRDGEWGRMLLKNIEKNGPPSSLGISLKFPKDGSVLYGGISDKIADGGISGGTLSTALPEVGSTLEKVDGQAISSYPSPEAILSAVSNPRSSLQEPRLVSLEFRQREGSIRTLVLPRPATQGKLIVGSTPRKSKVTNWDFADDARSRPSGATIPRRGLQDMSAECTPRTARRGEELTSRASMLDVDEPEVIYVKRAKDSSKSSSTAGPGAAAAAQASISVCDVDEHEEQRRGGGGGGSAFYSQGETADDHRQREGIDVILGPDQVYSRMHEASPAVQPTTIMSTSSRSPDVASQRGRNVAPLMHSQDRRGQSSMNVSRGEDVMSEAASPQKWQQQQQQQQQQEEGSAFDSTSGTYKFHFEGSSQVSGTPNERQRLQEGISRIAPTITEVARFTDTSFGSFGAPQTAYAGIQASPATPLSMPQQQGAQVQVQGGAHSVRYRGSSDKHLPTSKRGIQGGSGSFGAPSHVVAAEPKKKEEDKKAALFDLIGMMGWFEENLDPTIEREPGADRGESERERQARFAQEKQEKRVRERMYVATRLKAEEERRSRLAMFEATRVIQPAAASPPGAPLRDETSSDRDAGSNAEVPRRGELALPPGEGFRIVGGVGGQVSAYYASAVPVVPANGAKAVVYGEPLSAASSASVVMGVPTGGEAGTGFHYIAEGGTVAVGEWVPPPAVADPPPGVEASGDVDRESSSAPAETPSTSQKSHEWI